MMIQLMLCQASADVRHVGERQTEQAGPCQFHCWPGWAALCNLLCCGVRRTICKLAALNHPDC
jgi:hypothetical protein